MQIVGWVEMADQQRLFLIKFDRLYEEPLVYRNGFGAAAFLRFRPDVIEWLDCLGSNVRYTITTWVIRLYFSHENDALAFKLRWS